MKRKSAFLSLLLALCLMLTMALPASAAGSPKTIIQEMMNYYRFYESDALTDVYRLLDELESVDPEKADNWRKIMTKWDYAVNDLDSPYGCLPDGLPEDDSLCIVVMGYVLNRDGTMRDELVGRCQVALNSHLKYPNAYIICTGGGTASGNSKATEAGQMAKWLIEHGVDESKVIVEKRSLSSEQNAMNSVDILKNQYPQVNSMALISSDYHLRRCYVLFEATLALNDWDEDYTIVGTAGYDATQLGDEGAKIEAESIGLMVQIYFGGLKKPTLSTLEAITVQGVDTYMAGDELDLQVTAYYNTDFSRDVTPYVEYSGHDLTQPGIQDVTISYTENGVTATSTMQITVEAPPTEATTAPTQAPETEAPEVPTEATVPTKAEEKKDTPPIWPLFIPLILAVILIFKVNELIQRKRRKKQRPRKKMEWDA